MTIEGIGTDIIEVDRIAKSIEEHGERFLAKLFTEEEIAYCRRHQNVAQHVAGRFCAKEAFAKALGLGFGKHVAWRDIEILNDELGKPHIHLHGSLKERLTTQKIHVSISHTHTVATATVLIEA
ncbi:MAG: holo-ACP synthase [Simkaniaceae bacterium]|nr:holo-ACP synthase [Simkaniaceae bacterium]